MRPGSDNLDTYWGRQMKSKSAVNGYATNGTSNTRGANGFDGLLVGIMRPGVVDMYGTMTYFWSSSSYNENNAWFRYLLYSASGVYCESFNKPRLHSVRCKKN
jgi:uncharacterized protein (TIGR02145 family)